MPSSPAGRLMGMDRNRERVLAKFDLDPDDSLVHRRVRAVLVCLATASAGRGGVWSQ